MENKSQNQSGRRNYMPPAIEVIELPEAPQLLAQSQNAASRDDYESEDW